MIISKLLFVLVGDNDTGKTTVQKLLIEKLRGLYYDRLPVNQRYNITHPEIKRKYRTISFANRSYQEKKLEYGTVDQYFENHFNEADLAFIATHLDLNDISEIIRNGRQRFYNVVGVFLTNSIVASGQQNRDISSLEWNERLLIENVLTEHVGTMNRQLNLIADSFVFFIVNRTSIS